MLFRNIGKTEIESESLAVGILSKTDETGKGMRFPQAWDNGTGKRIEKRIKKRIEKGRETEMIYTVTFNPSLDYIVAVDGFRLGMTNRTSSELILPGGKGLNVSMVLGNLGIDSTAFGFVAGFTGAEIVRRVEEMGVKSDFIHMEEGVSRINLKLKSIEGTEINGCGPEIGKEAVEQLMEKLAALGKGDVLVLAGSIPKSIPDDIYRKIMERMAGRGVLSVVDATKKLMVNVLQYHPFLVKPNNHELGEIFGVELKTREEVIPYAERLREMGAVNVLVSMAGGRRAGRHITGRQAALSVLLPLYSVFNMYCMLYLVQIFPTKEMLVLLGINLLLLIGLNIYFCVLVDVMSENHRLENERNLYRTQAKMQHQYYQREEEKYEFSRKMIHDIRNHILAMEALYKEENAREAAAYAGDIHRMLNQFQQKYYTSEKLLNIILNDKANTMRRLGIQEDIRVGEISLDFMKETDVTALFANLLDNAVAAAGESKAGFVRVRVNQVRQFLSVTVENSCDREPEKETGIGGTFRSRRPGHEGMGLKIVQRTVEQYGGDVQYSWEDGVFTAHVMLIGL